MGKFARLIGVIVAAIVILGAALLWFGIAVEHPLYGERPRVGTLFGTWRYLYGLEVPPYPILLIAVGLALLFAGGMGILEFRFSQSSRRRLAPSKEPLAPRVVMEETRGKFLGEVTVTVLVPAHNEEGQIQETLESLRSQVPSPTRVIVVADNCTDRTIEIALAMGVEVIESVDNEHKKAGALNQALAQVLPGQGENDCVMIMDADTVLDDGFLAAAVKKMTDDRALMAVGGIFYGEDGYGILGQFQRNEYTRYARQIARRRGRVFVLTGTASMFRPRALRTVAAQRGKSLPGVPGDIYDTVALTEDNELTLALKMLGALTLSPRECTVVTEVMPTWRALWAQRLRWQRGALENLGAYGLHRQIFRYWAQQLGIGYGTIALSTFFLLIIISALAMDEWVWFPFWSTIGLIFMAERTVTVWRGGWKARLLAALVIPELIFASYLNIVYVKGIVDITFGRTAKWKHIEQGSGPTVEISS